MPTIAHKRIGGSPSAIDGSSIDCHTAVDVGESFVDAVYNTHSDSNLLQLMLPILNRMNLLGLLVMSKD